MFELVSCPDLRQRDIVVSIGPGTAVIDHIVNFCTGDSSLESVAPMVIVVQYAGVQPDVYGECLNQVRSGHDNATDS